MINESQSQRALRTGLDAAEDFGEMQVDQQPNSQVNMASPGNMMAALQEVQQNIMPAPNNNTVTDFSKAQDELYRASAARSILARRKRNKNLKDQQSRRGQENIIGNADDFNNNIVDEDDEPIE